MPAKAKPSEVETTSLKKGSKKSSCFINIMVILDVEFLLVGWLVISTPIWGLYSGGYIIYINPYLTPEMRYCKISKEMSLLYFGLAVYC